MFWHNLKYEVLSGLRVKDVLFWLILFPIVLATFFKIAFGSIYEKTTLFSTIPMAVVETTEQPLRIGKAFVWSFLFGFSRQK